MDGHTTFNDGITVHSEAVLDAPSAPTGLVLNQVNDTVIIQFSHTGENVDHYEVWSSVGSLTDFELVALIPEADIAATITVTDSAFNRIATINYKVYAVRRGVYSAALSDSITLSDNVGDVTNLEVNAELDNFVLTYDLPYHDCLSYVQIKKDAQDTEGALAEGNATTVYSGGAAHYTHHIPDAELEKYHKFWIDTIARTQKSVTLETTDVISVTDCCFSRSQANTYIYPIVNYQSDNYVAYRNDDAGDAVIANAIEVDDPYFISVGWGQGFAIHKIESNGSVTEVYHDNTPNNSDARYQSLAVDKTNKMAYVGNNLYGNIREYDYSAIFSGGDVVKGRALTEASHGLPSDEVGGPYHDGLQVVGDYLYINPDDKETSNVLRWQISTETADNVTVENKLWDGRYGGFTYDADNDRLYVIHQYYAGIWIVTDASLSTAKAWQVDVTAVGVSRDMYASNLVVDNDNSNHIWIIGDREVCKLDISNCIDPNGSATPTELKAKKSISSSPYLSQEEHSIHAHPDYGSDLILMNADRNYGRAQWIIDKVNLVPMGPTLWESLVSDGNPLYYKYGGHVPVKVQSGGNTYYVMSGYGDSGHQWYVYSSSLQLPSSWEAVFGTWAFDDNRNVRAVNVLPHDAYQMVGTTLAYYVSNDNGYTWEIATPGQLHKFSSTGYQVRLKLVGSGDAKNGAHITSSGDINVLLND